VVYLSCWVSIPATTWAWYAMGAMTSQTILDNMHNDALGQVADGQPG